MSWIRRSRLLKFALVLLLALGLFWHFLPRLLGAAAERWLHAPGLEELRLQPLSIGATQTRLDHLRAIWRSSSGLRLEVDFRDVVLDYSWQTRQFKMLSMAYAKIDLYPGPETGPAEWPKLEWPQIPFEVVNVKDIDVFWHRQDRFLPRLKGQLQAVQNATGGWVFDFTQPEGVLKLALMPGEQHHLDVQWRPENGGASHLQLQLGREPRKHPLMISAQIDAPLLVEIGKKFEIPFSVLAGVVNVQAQMKPGPMIGDLDQVKGELSLRGVRLHSDVGAAPWAADLEGKALFEGDVGSAAILLQPGLNWKFQLEGQEPVRVEGRLAKVFCFNTGQIRETQCGDFPLEVHTARWGRWDAAIKSLDVRRAKGTVGLQGIEGIQAQLRYQGMLPSWNTKELQLKSLQVGGEGRAYWSDKGAIGFGGKMEIKAASLSWAGKTPLQVKQAALSLEVQAKTISGERLWELLELQGEAGGTKLDVQQGDAPFVGLGPFHLRAENYRPAKQKGKFALSAQAIRTEMSKAYLLPDLEASVTLNGNDLQGKAALQLKKTDVLQFSARHVLSSGCGRGAVDVQQDMAKLGELLQPSLPALRPLALTAGKLAGHFDLDWCAQSKVVFKAQGDLTADKVDIGWERAIAKNVQIKLHLDALEPWQGSLLVAMPTGELGTGTPFSEIQFEAALVPKKLHVKTLRAKLMSGDFRATPAYFPWPLSDDALKMEVNSLDIASLLELIQVDGLSGTGRVRGVLPLAYREGTLEIRDGKLSGEGAGTIKYVPAVVVADNIGLQVLRNFHFQRLNIGLNYVSGGKYLVGLKLDGSNPDFYSGYPIRMGLNINGALPGVFRAAIFSGDFDRHILEQLQSGKLD